MTTRFYFAHFRGLSKKVLSIIALCLSIFSVNAQLANVPVTGFNNDIVANGVGPGTALSMPGVSNATIGVDGVGYTFIDATYKWQAANAFPTCFMPTSGLASSLQTPGLTYQFQSYSGNNSLTIDNNSTTYTTSPFPNSASLTLATPASFGKLYVLYESVVNVSPLTVDVVVTFTDLTTQTFPANTCVNWFTNTAVAFTNVARAQNVSPGLGSTCPVAPHMFELQLPIDQSNYAKQVQSITFTIPTNLTTGTTASTVNYFHAMAVGGIAACTVTPADQPTALVLNSATGTTATASFTAATSAPSNYLTVAYLSGATPTAPVNGVNYNVGNSLGAGIVVGNGSGTSLGASGLLPGQTYDVYIYSFNGVTCSPALYNTTSPLMGTITTSTVGATTLINPYGDGGFENGTTFASNGWTLVNGGAGNNNWFIGSTAVAPSSGARCAYIDNGTGVTNLYTNTNVTTVHFYKDITFPAGQSAINLSFKWKANGEASYDYITVYIMPTTNTPTVNVPAGAFQSWLQFPTVYPGASIYCVPPNLNLITTGIYQTQNICLPGSFAGTTQRVVFAWSNDPSVGTNPPGTVDEISLVSSTPTPPASQATALNLTTISTSHIDVSYTASTSLPAEAGYLVVRYPAGSAVTHPTTPLLYTVGSTLGLGTVAYVGNATSFSATGLFGGTNYDFYVYAYYNSTCPSGSVYNITTPLTGSQVTSPCGTLAGTVPVGPTAPVAPAGFATITEAKNYITLNGLGGATILELQTDYNSAYAAANETYPLAFPYNACVTAVAPLTIRPAAGVAAPIVLTAAGTLATIDLNGAANITFDGRPGGVGTSKMLTIANTLGTLPAVRLINEASNNAFRYCDLQSNNSAATATATGGVLLIGNTTGLFGNDNNVVDNCDIHNVTGGNPTVCINALGTNTNAIQNNDNNVISNCNLFDFFSTVATVATAGIYVGLGNSSWTITNNHIYQTVSRAHTGTVTHRGMWITPNTASLTSASGFNITGNYIGGNSAAGTGNYTMTGTSAYNFMGMDLSLGIGTVSEVQGNTITNINMTCANGASTAFIGIGMANGLINCGTTTANLIGSTTTNGAITFTTTVTLGGVIGIRASGGPLKTISNNIISGINLVGSATTVANSFNGINYAGGTLCTINNNTIGSATLANSINMTSTSATSTSAMACRGIISNTSAVNCTISNNLIANMNSNYSATGTAAATVVGIAAAVGINNVIGNTVRNLTSNTQTNNGGGNPAVIGISYTATTAGALVRGNTIHTLRATHPTATTGIVVAGIFYGGASGTTNVIEKNLIHSLAITSTTAIGGAITGMDIATGQVIIKNNMIRIGIDENGNSVTTPTLVRGITKFSAIANIYNNSIYIGGTGVLNPISPLVASNSFAFVRTATAISDDIRNNIFCNNRSNATTGGKHYQVSVTSIATMTLNNNVYSGNGTGGVFGAIGVSPTIVDYPTYSASWGTTTDNSSKVGDPQFINATGNASLVDLHIATNIPTEVEQNGVIIASVTDDYDSQTRATLTPDDIGADAGNFIPVNACAGAPSTSVATLTNTSNICSSGTKTIILTSFTSQPGLSYQWQESSTGLPGSFTNVTTGTGGTAYIYNTGTITSSTYFQCVVTCISTGLSTASLPVQAVVPGLFPGGFYTIDKTLSTGGGNYASFADAVNAITCGIAGPVIFEVAAGTGPYTEQVNIPQILGTSAVNTVTFLGNNEELTFNATLAAVPYTLNLNGADYFRFNDLRISGTGATYALVGHLWNNADYNVFTNCTFTAPANGTSTLQVPFSCSGSETSATSTGPSGSYNELIGCTMFSGYYNTCFVGNTASPNLGNKVINCNMRDQYFYASYNQYQNGIIISGNTIERPTRTTLSTFYGIYLTTAVTNALVEKNRIRKGWEALPSSTGTSYCIYDVVVASLGNENKIYNNLISDMNFNGTIYGIYLANYSKCYHNTISLDQTTASGTTTTYGIWVPTTTAAGIDVQNNNVSITRGGTGAKYCLYYQSAAGISSNYNNLYLNAAAGTSNCTGFYVASFLSLANWQAANGGIWDANSLNINPQFSAPLANVYKPTAFAMDNLGNTTLGITTDITGAARSATPDMGCYEFAPPTLDAGITWVAPVAPFVTGNQTVTVNIFNSAINTITDLEISYTDGLGAPVTETFTGLSIPASTSQTLSFTSQYNITANGTLKAYLTLVNGVTDDNIANDSTLLQTICIAFPGGTYTIDKNFPTGGGNYTSFADAVTALACGISGPVVFNVVAGSGPYNEQVSIGTVVGTSAVNTLTFNGNGNTLSFNATLAVAPHTFVLNGTDYVRVNNMIMEGTGPTYALVCHLWNDANNNQFTNCTFNAPANGTSTVQVPFSISGSPTSATTTGSSGSNNIVDGCTIFSGYYNTCFVGNSGLPNTGNQLINSNIRDQYFYGSYNLYQNGMIISGNTLDRPTRTTLSTYYGIYVVTGCTNMLVEKNKIRNVWATAPTAAGTVYCIYLSVDASVGNENKFYNNLISDINVSGTVYGMYMIGADYWKGYHNTVSLDQTSATGATPTYGIYCSGTLAYDVRNNNVTISRGGTGVKYAMTCTTPAIAISNNNNLYVSSTTGTNCVGFTTIGYATLAAWQATGLDLNSTSVDPAYNNPIAGDYRPTNVLLDNIGTGLGITTDITGLSRSVSAPDAGAYEFQVAPTDGGILTFVSPGTLGCYSTTQDVVVTVKNYGSLPLDFSVNPMIVTCNVTGAATATLTGSPTGILAVGATQNVTLGPTFDMSPNGTYTFTVTSVMTGDGNATNDALSTTPVRTVGLVTGTLTSSLSNVCISSPPTLTLTGNYGGNIQWQVSTVSATGPWTNVGTGGQTYVPIIPLTASGNAYYQAEFTCNSNTATSNVVTLVVTVPQLGSTTPGSRCGVGTVALGATGLGGASVNWYANPTGGIPLALNTTSFTTPVISSTTNYYVAPSAGGFTANVGMVSQLAATTGAGTTNFGLVFDVLSPFTLNSVKIYPISATSASGTVTIDVIDGAGTIMHTALFSVVGGPVGSGVNQTLNLNFNLVPGTNYKIRPGSFTGITGLLFEPSVGSAPYAYPFSFPGVVNINYSTLTAAPANTPRLDLYYYFYDWSISAGCEGTRTSITATVVPPPSVSVTTTASTICEGESVTLSVTSPNDPAYTYTWNPGALTGASVSVTPGSTTVYTLSAIDNTTGTYQTCAAQATQTITVNPRPDVFTATATPANICVGASATLNASLPVVSAFCTPTYSTGTGSGDFLTLVSIGGTTLNNPTGAAPSPFYTLYPATGSTTATLTAGSTYTVTFSAGTFSSNNDFAFWIDYNKNGTFELSERLGEFQDAINGPTTYSLSFTVPALAQNGLVRFRVREIYAMTVGGSDPCASFSFGETEDYDITIVGGVNPLTYNWEPGTLAGPSTSVTPSSTTAYTCTATNSFGCIRTASAAVTVNSPTSSSISQSVPCAGSYVWNGNTYTASGTYTNTTMGSNGCDSTATLVLTVAPCNTTLGLNVLIEGYWDGTSAMLPVLLNQGEPNTATQCDTITVELISTATVAGGAPYTPDYTQKAVLNTNGSATVVYPSAVASGNYYIVVKHRNALQTWSANAMAFPATTSYNFTDSASKAYGANQIEVAPGIFAMYSGDIAIDENIDPLDEAIVNADLGEFVFGYLYDISNTNYPGVIPSDINGDGNVDLLDAPAIQTNLSNFIFSSHP